MTGFVSFERSERWSSGRARAGDDVGNALSRVTVFSSLVYRVQSLVLSLSAVLSPYKSPDQSEIGRCRLYGWLAGQPRQRGSEEMRFVQFGAAVTAPPSPLPLRRYSGPLW